MENLGIYIHIPFCAKKCAYCDFYSMCDLSLRENYVDALISQISSFRAEAKNRIVDIIYIGGGTPSILSGEQILRILKTVRKTFKVSEDAEITMEANPGTLNPEKLVAYHEAGINRLSIGLQSANSEELSTLGRIHTKEEFERSFLLARLEGFQNINVDIMYALPGQTEQTLSETLDYVIGLDPDHISFYGLTIEPETPFGRNKDLAKLLPNEDIQVEMYLNAAEKMEAAGFFQYEISNFSKPGFECHHNMKYWKVEDYLGFGPAAHSFFDGTRFAYAKNTSKFISYPTQKECLIEMQEQSSIEDSALEFVMLGFRLRAGIDVVEYGERFGEDFEDNYGEKMQEFIEKEYIMKTKNGYRLSRRGFLISNYILSEILNFEQDSE